LKTAKVVNPLALQGSQSSLIMLHTHQRPLSQLIKWCTFIVKQVMLFFFI
jgi:hypothetical protein